MNEFLFVLPLLACPVGMGMVMWFMTRGGRKQGSSTSGGSGERSVVSVSGDAALRARHEASAQSMAQDQAQRG